MAIRFWFLACLVFASFCLQPTSAFSDISYQFSTSWPAKAPMNLAFPTGIGVGAGFDSGWDLFVADPEANAVRHFPSVAITTNFQNVEFGFPTGVTVKGSTVYVADSLNHQIRVFDNFGSPIGTPWGGPGSADGQFRNPVAVAVDKDGNVYVSDSWNNRIQKFTSTGTFIRKWGTYGTGDGQFTFPYGIAVDSFGFVYVADAGDPVADAGDSDYGSGNRIQKFNADGVFVSAWGTKGTGDGQFDFPAGLTIDTGNKLYVADVGNNRIQKFDTTGAFELKWGTLGEDDGMLNVPVGVTAAPDGYVYVADSGNGRIQKFSTSGVFQQSWDNKSQADGFFKMPMGAAVDSGGNVLVTDGVNSRIQKFDSNGTFLTKFGSMGNGDGQLLGPVGIAIDTAQNVYVANTLNNRIEKFTSAGAFAAKYGTFGSADGQFSTPKGIALDGSNNMYVVDTGNNRIQKIGSNGTFIKKWGGAGTADGLFDTPTAIAIDHAGYVYVSDTYNNRIQKFLADGTFVAKWGTLGNGTGQFNHPAGLTVDPSNNLFVVDTYNHRIQQFTPDGTFVTTFGVEGSNVSAYGGAYFERPSGIAMNTAGSALYVADTGNRWMQKYQLKGIQLTGPKGGERWPAGSTQKITWNNIAETGILQLQWVKGGSDGALITPTYVPPYTFITLSPGAGSYDWTIPAGLTLGSDYQIALAGGTSSSVSGNFSITGPQYLLTINGAAGTAAGGVAGGFGVQCNITSGGIASGACTENEDQQSTVTLTATPPVGGTVTWGGCTSVNGNSCSVSMTSNKTVTASFDQPVYSITTAPGANGGISCTPVTGGSSACTITPSAGYYVSDVTVGPTGGTATSTGAVTTYNFTSIASNMTITASFLPYPVKRTGSAVDYFSTLSGAYAAAANLDVIMGRALVFTENITCNRNIQVKFSGGYDTPFATRTGATTVKGTLKITNGKVVADKVVCHQ